MPLSEKLTELSKLSDNWDFRGSSAPSDAAIQAARNMTAVPLGSGGLQLEMHAGGIDIEIEIDQLGKVMGVGWSHRLGRHGNE